jgi:hypothetical protein
VAGRVEEAADEGFPTGHELDFIEKESDGLSCRLGEKAEVDVRNEMQIVGGHAGKTLILKVEVDQPVGRTAFGEKVGAALMEETGFSGPTHADHGKGFAWNGRKQGITPGQWRWRMLDRSRHLFLSDLFKLDFHRV